MEENKQVNPSETAEMKKYVVLCPCCKAKLKLPAENALWECSFCGKKFVSQRMERWVRKGEKRAELVEEREENEEIVQTNEGNDNIILEVKY